MEVEFKQALQEQQIREPREAIAQLEKAEKEHAQNDPDD